MLRCLPADQLSASTLADAVIAVAVVDAVHATAGPRRSCDVSARHRRAVRCRPTSRRVSDWLDPVRAALDASPKAVPFFIRDDDAGWDDEGLGRLLDRCAARDVHIDVAVIPVELDRPLAATLCTRAATGLVHLHQHGFRHVNHENNGRKYEFGPSRSHDQQLADIAEGRALIDEHLHPYVDSVFTPPWNRCTDETAAALANLGFKVLSRDRTAEQFGREDLAEVPVTVDWFAKRKGEPLTRDDDRSADRGSDRRRARYPSV